MTIPAKLQRAALAIVTMTALSGCEVPLADGGSSGGSGASATAGTNGGSTTVSSGSASANAGGTTTASTASPTSASTVAASGGDTSGVAESQKFGIVHRGEGTYYGATGAGNCSFDPSPDNLMVAAMNARDYAGSAVCGQFIEVTGPSGKVVVRITDQCPECKPGDVDLSMQAFARIAPLEAGRVPISWQVVAGDVQGPVTYRYKEGSTRYWTAIQVRNHRLSIIKLELLPIGATNWINVPRTDYNYFLHDTPIEAGSVQVRVTAVDGSTIRNLLPEPQGGLVVSGTAQF